MTTGLPPDVAEALRRGEPLQAMKLLRASAQMSLQDAKAAIDGVTGRPSGQKPSLQELFGGLAPTARGSRPSAKGPTQAAPQRPEALRAPRESDLSPGEVPRRGGFWGIVGVVAVLLYAWFRLRGG